MPIKKNSKKLPNTNPHHTAQKVCQHRLGYVKQIWMQIFVHTQKETYSRRMSTSSVYGVMPPSYLNRLTINTLLDVHNFRYIFYSIMDLQKVVSY